MHFYRNVLAKVPKPKRSQAAAMLKAIQAMEPREASAAKVVRDGCAETLAYCNMPCEHWRCTRANNAIERLNRETRRRTHAVGTFPNEKLALMPMAALLKHVADGERGTRRYLDASLLKRQSC